MFLHQSLAYNIVVPFVNECNSTWVAFDETPYFSTSFSVIFIFISFSFSSISLPSVVYISSFSILSFYIFSFNVCWSFLACLGVINFNFISCPLCLKQRERLSRLSVLKWSRAHLKGIWQEFVGARSLYLFILFVFFNFPSFYSLYLFFFYSFFFYFLLQPMLIHTTFAYVS